MTDRAISESGGRTILLVEDDDEVRQVTGVLLGGLGYRILEAARASAALAVLEAERDIDLMLTDIVMPGEMNGIELAAAARQRRPALRILFTSGYAEDLAAGSPIADRVLQKPYRFEELADRVGAALS
jgi:CheY-like chemotaxis protein